MQTRRWNRNGAGGDASATPLSAFSPSPPPENTFKLTPSNSAARAALTSPAAASTGAGKTSLARGAEGPAVATASDTTAPATPERLVFWGSLPYPYNEAAKLAEVRSPRDDSRSALFRTFAYVLRISVSIFSLMHMPLSLSVRDRSLCGACLSAGLGAWAPRS